MSEDPSLGPGAPSSPIELPDAATATDHMPGRRVAVSTELLGALARSCSEVITDAAACRDASRDWWPLAMVWALGNEVPASAGVIARPCSTAEVSAVLRLCDEAGVPVTAAGGRSGVCGASVPLHGGVLLDLTELAGLREVDDTALVVRVAPGTFGDHLEAELRNEHGLTLGHWPQSIALSTVGGWLACRSAGQLSNRYGKIEDMVVGLEVVLADGTVIETGGGPRSATGPDLTQLFVGSEGTLGVITDAWLRVRPAPETEAVAAFGFASWQDGMEACRVIMRRGADPAVLRLYDEVESDRSYRTGDLHVLLVLDEGDPATVAANMSIVSDACSEAARLDDALVRGWLGHRNDVSSLESLIRNDFVVDTMEISGSWSALEPIYADVVEALRGVDGVRAASAHQSHAYTDGACLYFTFAGRPPDGDRDGFYRRCWDLATQRVLAHGGVLSHHHGIGLNRARFMSDALGPAAAVLASLKAALDPRGILNPGKLGLPDPFESAG